MIPRHLRKIQALWFLDVLLLATSIVLWRKSLGIDLYIHDVYFVPALGHLLLVPWLLLTLSLAAAALLGRNGPSQPER
jgi:hypothetical protein